MLLSVKKLIRPLLLICFASCLCHQTLADEVLFTIGAGPQQGSEQKNQQIGLDYSFFNHVRSKRSGFSVGISYTYLKTDASSNKTMEAFSIYPQLTLWPQSESLQGWFFFVRALGPSYISSNMLGDRKQDHHFAFQAQVGLGYEIEIGNDQSLLLQGSFKHFSNANLFHDNDGIDIPFVFSLGYKY